MRDRYTDVKDVESTESSSQLSGSRSASEFIQLSDGKDSSALDSTQATSTVNGARSVEQIMDELKEEEKAKKSKSSSMMDKWKKTGVNAKPAADAVENTADSVTDAVADIADSSVGKLAKAAVTGKVSTFGSPLMTAAVSFGASKLGISGMTDDSEKSTDVSKVSEMMAIAAPTDAAIATYQQNVSSARENGANVKYLPFTDEQQAQWNAQDQHRMYSNYGMMYEHGDNEASYNMALLNANMSVAGFPVTKTLPQVPSFKQKYLSEVQKDDKQMDINGIDMNKLFTGEVDLLHVGEQSKTEDMSLINGGQTKTQDIASSFADATKQGVKAFTDNILDRGATVTADLAGVGINLSGDKSQESEFSSNFF